MKVAIFPKFGEESGQGGIKRVVEAQHKYLPDLGVEIVKDYHAADLVNVHADDLKTSLPIAYSNHGLYWHGFDWMNWSYDANAKIIRAMKRAASVSVPSRWVHNSLARGMLLNPFVLPHGVDIEEWEPAENFGYILWAKNRPDPICDPRVVDNIAQQCSDLKFITTFGQKTDNVMVTGKLTYDRSRELIRHAGLYLATVQETGAITVLEAMAAGVPCIGWAHGANTEIITHKVDGYLVEPGDYAELREGIYYCLQNRNALGEAARQTIIDRFQWRDRIRDYIPFYQAALGEVRDSPAVSVIVTAYNLEKYLPGCIESITQQRSFDDWEMVIVDDHSPDRCGEIADDYAKRDNRIKVIHNPSNVYLAEARNIGIRHSSGKYIIPLDADDMLSPDALRILSGELDKRPDIDIATGSFELIEPDGRHWVSTWPPNDPSYNLQIQKRNQVPYASMYRRWVWERTGGYRRRMKSAEDAEFWTRAMSYGAEPAKVTDMPTLIYHNRPDSMSHVTKEPEWTSWFIWSKYPQFTPYGASGKPTDGSLCRPVLAYHPTEISVIIPCGPGHEQYLQDAVDSIVAQTFQNWEIIIVNDTGNLWENNPYIRSLPPFVKILSTGGRKGTAAARNLGIKHSTSKAFVLLDADDYAQPLLLDALYKTYKEFGGWIYPDWYDQEGNLKEAQDFRFESAMKQMPGPVTGIYSKADWELVGGFDESMRYWEDWDFQLSLMEHDICGTRLIYPGFTYRYHTGQNRENSFEHAEEVLEYIRNKHKKLYSGDCYK